MSGVTTENHLRFFISSSTSNWSPQLTNSVSEMFLKSGASSVSTTGFRPGLDHVFARVFNLAANIFSLIPFLPQPISRLLLKNKCVHVTVLLKSYYWHSLMHGAHARLLAYCMCVLLHGPTPARWSSTDLVLIQGLYSSLLLRVPEHTVPFQPFNRPVCLETSSQFPPSWRSSTQWASVQSSLPMNHCSCRLSCKFMRIDFFITGSIRWEALFTEKIMVLSAPYVIQY